MLRGFPLVLSALVLRALVVKNPLVNAEDRRDVGLIPGLGRREKGRTIDSSILVWRINPTEREAYRVQSIRLQKAGHD